MSPNDARFIADIRAEFESGANFVVACGALVIFPDEIVGKSDDELLAYIAGRLTEK